jgi:DNA polymerase-3 subunit beta
MQATATVRGTQAQEQPASNSAGSFSFPAWENAAKAAQSMIAKDPQYAADRDGLLGSLWSLSWVLTSGRANMAAELAIGRRLGDPANLIALLEDLILEDCNTSAAVLAYVNTTLAAASDPQEAIRIREHALEQEQAQEARAIQRAREEQEREERKISIGAPEDQAVLDREHENWLTQIEQEAREQVSEEQDPAQEQPAILVAQEADPYVGRVFDLQCVECSDDTTEKFIPDSLAVLASNRPFSDIYTVEHTSTGSRFIVAGGLLRDVLDQKQYELEDPALLYDVWAHRIKVNMFTDPDAEECPSLADPSDLQALDTDNWVSMLLDQARDGAVIPPAVLADLDKRAESGYALRALETIHTLAKEREDQEAQEREEQAQEARDLAERAEFRVHPTCWACGAELASVDAPCTICAPALQPAAPQEQISEEQTDPVVPTQAPIVSTPIALVKLAKRGTCPGCKRWRVLYEHTGSEDRPRCAECSQALASTQVQAQPAREQASAEPEEQEAPQAQEQPAAVLRYIAGKPDQCSDYLGFSARVIERTPVYWLIECEEQDANYTLDRLMSGLACATGDLWTSADQARSALAWLLDRYYREHPVTQEQEQPVTLSSPQEQEAPQEQASAVPGDPAIAAAILALAQSSTEQIAVIATQAIAAIQQQTAAAIAALLLAPSTSSPNPDPDPLVDRDPVQSEDSTQAEEQEQPAQELASEEQEQEAPQEQEPAIPYEPAQPVTLAQYEQYIRDRAVNDGCIAEDYAECYPDGSRLQDWIDWLDGCARSGAVLPAHVLGDILDRAGARVRFHFFHDYPRSIPADYIPGMDTPVTNEQEQEQPASEEPASEEPAAPQEQEAPQEQPATITIDGKALAAALKTLKLAAATKATLPVLQNVLIYVNPEHPGAVRLSCTNLEVGMSITLAAQTAGEFAITIPHRLLMDTVQAKAGAAVLTLDPVTRTVKIEQGKARNAIKGISADEFPIVPTQDTDPMAILPAAVLADAARRVTYAACTDDARPVLAGIYCSFDRGTDRVTFAAADGFRLAKWTSPEHVAIRPILGPSAQNGTPYHKSAEVLIIPARSFPAIAKLTGTVRMYIEPNYNKVLFRGDNMEVTSRLIEGNYVDIKRVIPTEEYTAVYVDRAEFADAVHTLRAYAKDSAMIARFTYSWEDPQALKQPGKLLVQANAAEVGDRSIELECQIERTPMTQEELDETHAAIDALKTGDTKHSPVTMSKISDLGSRIYAQEQSAGSMALNCLYTDQAAASFAGATLRIAMRTPGSPAKFQSTDPAENEQTAVIMPMYLANK